MPGPARRGVLPRRGRRDEDGEDESSVIGELDDFSMSEGSAISNGDDEVEGEGSEVSAEDNDARASFLDKETPDFVIDDQTAPTSNLHPGQVVGSNTHSKLHVTANGLPDVDSTMIDDTQTEGANRSADNTFDRETASVPHLSGPQETSAERSRREHLEYIRQRNSNPAFVPNRGGFFLHDDRSPATSSPYGRPFPRGRGRGYHTGYGAGRGYNQPPAGLADRPWAHDLHDAVNRNTSSPAVKTTPSNFQIPTAKPAVVAPNRTFSVTTILGNVTVQIFLPGMDTRKTFQNVVKRQHTLLPQHRPPLRRDKPVRISIPDEEPRHIFPSTERSFIFIPRAMRPNQQVYTRGRGRGSFHGSRRGSIMGSTYTPSIAMSRRSSLGGAGSTGFNTPTDGHIPRGPMATTFNRPVVRMPVGPFTSSAMPPTSLPVMPVTVPYEQSFGPAILHSPTVALPMHQPRPQKTVSVAEIESPAVKAPQQQQEQPFHQQMPPGVSLTDTSAMQQGQPAASVAIGASLSHIPEAAVYAQPFQPYPIYPQSAYYGPALPGNSSLYPTPADPYNMSMYGPVLAPQFVPGQHFGSASRPNESGGHSGAMAHETNGMVYYYDPAQFPTDGSQMPPYSLAVGGGMVGVPATGPFFYPAVPGGVFYPTGQ